MARLTTKDNMAVFEYPTENLKDPQFDFDSKTGVLFLFGYDFFLAGKKIGAAKRFELNISGYHLVGNYETARQIIQGDFSDIINEANIDLDNSVFFIKPSAHLLNKDQEDAVSDTTTAESNSKAR